MEETPPKESLSRPRRRRSGWSIKLTPMGLLLLFGLNAGLLALVAWPLLELRQYLPITPLVTFSPEQPSRTPTLTTTLEPTELPSPTATQIEPTDPSTPIPAGAHPLLQGLIAMAVEDGLYSHLYAYLPEGDTVQLTLPLTRLTSGPWNDSEPAISADGERLVFASDRNGYWDLYVLELATGFVIRLTDTLEYESAPSWSPDGIWVAYETYVEENLEVVISPVDGSQPPIRLTDNPAADYSPAWSPDGRQIAFVSNRSGYADIWLANLDQVDEQSFRNLSNTAGDEAHPSWSHDGTRLAWASVKEGFHNIYVWDALQTQTQPHLVGGGDWPVFSPDGATLLSGMFQPNRYYLTAYATGQNGLVLSPIAFQGTLHGLDWGPTKSGSKALRDVYKQAASETPEPLWQLLLAPSGEIPGRQQVIELPDVQAPQPNLHDFVDEAFNALRKQLAEEVGWDFLSSLENAYTPLTSPLDPGMGNSWLYTGRAFTVVTVPINAGWMAVVREDFGQETFWRVYLRSRYQDGSAGVPLHNLPWDFNARLDGDVLAYEQGGVVMDRMPQGYWVDLTRLAADYGWERLPALSFWRSSYRATRFNEFVMTGGLDWRTAMLELYPAEVLITPSPVVPPTITLTPTPRWYQSPTPTLTYTPRPTLTPMSPAAEATETPLPVIIPQITATSTSGVD